MKKERNVLFNNVLNTFYLWLYGVGHMVKDHSAATWATLPISSISYTGALAGMRNNSMD